MDRLSVWVYSSTASSFYFAIMSEVSIEVTLLCLFGSLAIVTVFALYSSWQSLDETKCSDNYIRCDYRRMYNTKNCYVVLEVRSHRQHLDGVSLQVAWAAGPYFRFQRLL